MPYIEVEPNVRLFIRDWGKGKPIVFLHGWPYSHEMFEYQFIELAQHYRCIGIDLRGYGKSDKPWCDYSFDLMADDVKRVIEALELTDVTLLGFSMSGAISIRYMARHQGAYVSKLILMSAAAPCLTVKPDFPDGMNPEVFNGFIDTCKSDRTQMISQLNQATFNQPISSELNNWFLNLGMAASPHATIMGAVALRDEDLRADLSKIDVPTVIFHGEQDKTAPIEITAEVNHRGIKNSKLIKFKDSGHNLFYDEKDKANRELMKFINS